MTTFHKNTDNSYNCPVVLFILSYIDISRDVVKRMKRNNLAQNPQNLTAIFPSLLMGTRHERAVIVKKDKNEKGKRGKKSQIFNIGR